MYERYHFLAHPVCVMCVCKYECTALYTHRYCASVILYFFATFRLALFVAESNEMKWNSGWKTSFTSSKARVAPSNSWSVCLRLCRANQWSCPIGSGIGLHIMFVLYIDQLAKIHLIKFVSTPLTKYLLVMWKYVLESQVETILLNRRVLLIYYFTLGRRMANEAVC